MKITVKRAYEEATEDDGFRVLVDRLWPRGIRKEALRIDMWLKELAPSTELRRSYGHDPDHWEDFRSRYFEELDQTGEPLKVLLSKAREGRVTLVYAARDKERNNAAALRDYLQKKVSP